MVVVACCCCIPYRLALMLAPTFAPCVLTFAPYTLTFGPCACGVSLLSTGANIPLAQVVVVISCNLRSWCFFIQPLAQIVHLHMWWYHPLQLALVVLFHPATGANTVCALIFAGFNVRGFRGSAAIREYFVREHLNVTVNGHVHSSSQSMTSCITKMAISRRSVCCSL